MRLTVTLLIITAIAVAGCAGFAPGAGSSPAAPTGLQSKPPSTTPAAPKETLSPSAGNGDTGDIRAAAACDAAKNNIQMISLNSGEATVAAAYEVTGKQLAAYLEATSFDSMIAPGESTWRDRPDAVVDVCMVDGDFITKTPGPPGHDTSAVRILVVIADGQAFPWAIARTDPKTLPTTDPGSITQVTRTTQPQ